MIPDATRSEIPPPCINISSTNAGVLDLEISSVTNGHTYHIEYLDQLTTNSWQAVHCCSGTNTHWTTAPTNEAGFFRVLAETNHYRAGQVASLDIPGFHNVSGTAHIINNCTIELRSFNYDGGGIVVQVILSPNSSFSPYTAISEDLFGSAYTNATLALTLPENVNLDDANYISIWCVAANADFGSGPFQ
jgi:hypothetical protein